MKLSWQDMGLMLFLAILWGGGGYVVGIALQSSGILYPPLSVILAGVNLVIGLMLFLGVTKDPTAERMFFEGPAVDEDGDVRIGCLWLLPASILVFGLTMWVGAILARFFLSR